MLFLLMLSVVNDETYRVLADLAHSLGMGVLTEASNEEEFERALALGAKLSESTIVIFTISPLI